MKDKLVTLSNKIIDFTCEYFLTQDIFNPIIAGIILALLFFLIRDHINKKTNLSGKWKMYETTLGSDYNPFLGMKLVSTINILHSEKNILGSGEKISETTLKSGEKIYTPEERTKYSIQGNYEWKLLRKDVIKLIYQHKNTKGRDVASFIHLKKMKKGRLEGWFISEAANSSGTVTLIKGDFAEFGKGLLYRKAILFSKIFNVELVENIEHHFIKNYSRSRNLQNNNTIFEKMLVEIEDRKFYRHSGVSLKSLLRGFLSNFKIFRKKFKLFKSGGSTISMQLARTLFIKDYHKTFRRKPLEIIFAWYLEKILSKEEILKMYLISVRFYYKIHGIRNATTFFNFKEYIDLTPEEGFFLIERLSNTKNTYSLARINFLYRKVVKNAIDLDFDKIVEIYQKSIFTQIK